LHEFVMGADHSVEAKDDGVVDLVLPESVSIEAGSGIIGRRVSLIATRAFSGAALVGEGIIGFNF